MIRLTPPTEAHQRATYSLEGVTIALVWHYTARDGAWRVDILDDSDAPIRMGRKLSPGSNPFRGVTDQRMPPGTWWFSCPDEPPGRDAFDDGRASLVYFTTAESAALHAEARATQPVVIITEN